MKALDDITTLTEIRAYAAAEAADAAKQCPAAYNDYKTAVDMVAGYTTWAGTALEITYVEMIRQMIKNARNTWYAVGCAAPSSDIVAASVQTAEPVDSSGGAAMAIGGGASNYVLLIAALGAAIWYFGSKKKGSTKSKAKRTTRRRTVRRRRR